MQASSLAERFRILVLTDLRNAGMLAPDQDLFTDGEPTPLGTDLIPALLRTWRATGCRSGKMYDWLQSQQARGARLTLGIPDAASVAVCRWLGMRLAWWPDGIPAGRRIGVASSRLGRKLESQETWFTLLRAACAKIDTAQDIVLAANGTAPERFVRRAAELFSLRLLRVDVPQSKNARPVQWLKSLPDRDLDDRSERCWRLVLSPASLESGLQADELLTQCAPDRDRTLVALADRLLAFHVRRGGQLFHLLKHRLADPAWPLASVYVALGNQMVSEECEAELLDAGAVGWVVPAILVADQPDQSATAFDVVPSAEEHAGTLIRVPSATTWDLLTHCTRRFDGPWPDQKEDEYLDDLILHDDVSDHSAFSALRRIVATRRLLASSQAIRGKTAVVCFTAVPLTELSELHVYRTHRTRWDFQPYGICIRRQWLEQRGARPVQYGNDQLWSALPPDERPFFQVRQSSSGHVDWSVEQEWRHVGEVDLADLPADAALLFVRSQAEAVKLARESPWPVAVVDW